MVKKQLTELTIRTAKVIDSCETWEQCVVAEKYMKLALNQISKYYRNKFNITRLFKDLKEELGIVHDLYSRMKKKYSQVHNKGMYKWLS